MTIRHDGDKLVELLCTAELVVGVRSEGSG